MKIEVEILRKKIKKARAFLQERGIIAVDGSGEEDIEEIFWLMSLIVSGKLIIERSEE